MKYDDRHHFLDQNTRELAESGLAKATLAGAICSLVCAVLGGLLKADDAYGEYKEKK